MRLKTRFAINLLTPTPLAATTLTLVFFAKEPSVEALWFAAYASVFGYIYGILPSLAHAIWLQHRYRAGLDPRSHRAVGLSTASGFFAGLAIGLFFTVVGNGDPGGLLMFVPLGAATGALNGLLQFLIREKPAR